MAGATAAHLRVILDAEDKASKKFTGTTQAAKKTEGGLGTLKKAFIALGAAATVAGVARLGKAMLDNAAQVEQMGRKASIVFGTNLTEVTAWARANSEAFGTSTTQTINMAAGLQDLLIPMKFTRDEATKMSLEIAGLSGALAEWSAGKYDAREVSQILAKALMGERETLKELGISIMEVEVQNRAGIKGRKDMTDAQKAQAKATATLELIMEKSTDAQKAFTEGGDTLYRTQQKVNAAIAEAKDAISIAFAGALRGAMPIIKDAATWLREFGSGMQVAMDIGAEMRGTIPGAFGEVAASLPPVIERYQYLKDQLGEFAATTKLQMGPIEDLITGNFELRQMWRESGLSISEFGDKLLTMTRDSQTAAADFIKAQISANLATINRALGMADLRIALASGSKAEDAYAGYVDDTTTALQDESAARVIAAQRQLDLNKAIAEANTIYPEGTDAASVYAGVVHDVAVSEEDARRAIEEANEAIYGQGRAADIARGQWADFAAEMEAAKSQWGEMETSLSTTTRALEGFGFSSEESQSILETLQATGVLPAVDSFELLREKLEASGLAAATVDQIMAEAGESAGALTEKARELYDAQEDLGSATFHVTDEVGKAITKFGDWETSSGGATKKVLDQKNKTVGLKDAQSDLISMTSDMQGSYDRFSTAGAIGQLNSLATRISTMPTYQTASPEWIVAWQTRDLADAAMSTMPSVAALGDVLGGVDRVGQAAQPTMEAMTDMVFLFGETTRKTLPYVEDMEADLRMLGLASVGMANKLERSSKRVQGLGWPFGGAGGGGGGGRNPLGDVLGPAYTPPAPSVVDLSPLGDVLAGSYQHGGVVPGPIGSPQPIIAHGGEEVRTRAQQRGGGVSVHFHGPVYGDRTAIGEVVVEAVRDAYTGGGLDFLGAA